ncbi:MAG: hypothetical protein KGS72_21495 [Cyanobacteria bacterium REEB67]|nr:hypothetical protein [Cyanobacteria bacterium REEB67]
MTEDPKKLKAKEKKRSRQSEAERKKVFKQAEKRQKKSAKEDAKTTEPRPKQNAQGNEKPANKKLKEVSTERKKALTPKARRPTSEKQKAISKAVQEDKKSRLSTHLQEKAKSRQTLEKQRLSLEAEVKALNNLSNVKDTVDGQYTAKFSGFQSAIAAGPMGATSTGLRKLDPSIWINMQRAELGAKIQNKIEPKVLQQMAKIGKIARDLKLSNLKELKSARMESTVKVAKEANAEMKKIVNSKLRSKIKEIKEKERMRDPNRDPNKFEELNMPFRGVGGIGGT